MSFGVDERLVPGALFCFFFSWGLEGDFHVQEMVDFVDIHVVAGRIDFN